MRRTLRRLYNSLLTKEQLFAPQEPSNYEPNPEKKNQSHTLSDPAVNFHALGHGHIDTPASHNKHRLSLVFGLTAAYLVVEVVGGFLTHSLALLADAGHMLTDVAGLGLAEQQEKRG